MFIRNSVLFVVLLLFSLTLSAEVPNTFNYQGRLTDPSGEPVADDNYLIKFIIYDNLTGGTELWNSNYQLIEVSSGVFSYNLGSDIPLPAGIFSDTNRYLGIVVGTDPEISPRTRLISTPYAFSAGFATSASSSETSTFANDAASLNGMAPSYYRDWNSLINVPSGFSDNIDNENLVGIVKGQELPPNSLTTLSTTAQAICSLAVDAPVAGYVFIHASAQVFIYHDYGEQDNIGFTIDVTPDYINTNYINTFLVRIPSMVASAQIYVIPATGYAILPVTAGTNVFYFNAQIWQGETSPDRVLNPHMDAIFIPNNYSAVKSSEAPQPKAQDIDYISDQK